jgi:hypothetical protein
LDGQTKEEIFEELKKNVKIGKAVPLHAMDALGKRGV